MLLVSLMSASVVHASEAIRPDPAVEAKAAQVLWNLNMKLRKARPRNHPSKPDEIDPYLFRRVALSLARLGRVQTALRVLAWKPLPDMSYARNDVLRLAVRRSAVLGKVEQAQSFIPQIDNHNAKADAFLALALAYLQKQDYAAAQKVLFKVTPQVPDNYKALLYTAVLFAKSQDMAVSRRLFARAKKMIPTEKEYKKNKSPKPGLTPFNQRARFGYSLLAAGFIDEWLQYRTSGEDQLTFPSDREIPLLLQQNNMGTLVSVVHHMKPNTYNVPFAITAATCLASNYPHQALAILNEASAVWLKNNQALQGTTDSTQTSPEGVFAFFSTEPINFMFADAYEKLGEKQLSQQWKQRINTAQQNKQPLAQFLYHLLPIIVYNDSQPINKTTFPPAQLNQINNDIQPYLPALQDKFKAVGMQRYTIETLMQTLIKMQLDTDQKAQAQTNIIFLDIFLRKSRTSGMSDADLFVRALNIAELWKMAGDQTQCDGLLKYAFDATKKTSRGIKLFNLSTLIQKGFINVGIREFHALSSAERKDIQADDIPTELEIQKAIARPEHFLAGQLKSGISPKETPEQLYREVNVLYPFVKHVTRNLFPSQNERHHLLTSDGMAYFQY
jgi:tetratricopeptide (TPR) repeat protein